MPLELNDKQKEVVFRDLSYCLVHAGAGSGKTGVLVERIKYLITHFKAESHEILAVTFTNNAANEMKTRVASSLNYQIPDMWAGTFHSIANRILREKYREANLSQDFKVIDAEEQKIVLSYVLEKFDYGLKLNKYELGSLANDINVIKCKGLRANSKLKNFDALAMNVYGDYQKYCDKHNLVDFPELLLRSYELLRDNEDVRRQYQAQLKYCLVDEFQDTNTIQYLWFKLIAENSLSITIAADDDQLIYGFRGANSKNLHYYLRDFENVKVVRLEQNYRSTTTIVDSARSLIGNNIDRFGKDIWTSNQIGEPVTLYKYKSGRHEGKFICNKISELLFYGYELEDIAIFYRVNRQSRIIEEELNSQKINYKIYDGKRFYEREEIKAAIGYLKLMLNPNDNFSFFTVINKPIQIDESVLNLIKKAADKVNVSYYHASKILLANLKKTDPKKVLDKFSGLKKFIELIDELGKFKGDVQEASKVAVYDTGLLKYYKGTKNSKDKVYNEQVDSLAEFLSSIAEFDSNLQNDSAHSISLNKMTTFNHDKVLPKYFDYVALNASSKVIKKIENGVNLMTVHAAKGLEFPVVIIAGLSKGYFPHQLSENIEDDRRLLYVAMTRAMNKLVMSISSKNPSPFICELVDDLVLNQDDLWGGPTDKTGEIVKVSSNEPLIFSKKRKAEDFGEKVECESKYNLRSKSNTSYTKRQRLS